MRYNIHVVGQHDFYCTYTRIGTELVRTRERGDIVFEESEVLFNPWEHIVRIPVEERDSGAFAFSHCFESSSFYEFVRDGIQYSVHFSNVTREE